MQLPIQKQKTYIYIQLMYLLLNNFQLDIASKFHKYFEWICK